MRNLMRIQIDTVWNKMTFVVESLESSRREVACGNFVEGIIPSHCPTKWVSCDVIEMRNNSIKQTFHVAHAGSPSPPPPNLNAHNCADVLWCQELIALRKTFAQLPFDCLKIKLKINILNILGAKLTSVHSINSLRC